MLALPQGWVENSFGGLSQLGEEDNFCDHPQASVAGSFGSLPQGLDRHEGGAALPSFQELEDALAADGILFPAAGATPGRPERILVIEDNPINQKTVLHYLEKLGFKPHAAANGYQAIDRLEMLPYDLILMDCKMPGLDGFSLAERIRNGDSPNRATPIIAITADGMATSREKCLRSGMDDYLPKPFNMQTLQQMIHEWVKP